MSALVSVLVPCYRDAHLVTRALPRLLEGSRCKLEVVLLNNDLDQLERMRDLVVSLGDARVRLLELEHGVGFAKAINTGLAATTGEIVFFANSDLFVADGYLDELVSFFERRPSAGCASGKILRYDLVTYHETDVIDTTGLTIGRNRRVADRGENERDVGQFEREEEVFGVSGAALVARRKALEDVTVAGECLDESFHMYKEDVDLSWRLRLAGWECWYVPSAVAYHGRTIHGSGRRSYLADVRRFHENERSEAGLGPDELDEEPLGPVAEERRPGQLLAGRPMGARTRGARPRLQRCFFSARNGGGPLGLPADRSKRGCEAA